MIGLFFSAQAYQIQVLLFTYVYTFNVTSKAHSTKIFPFFIVRKLSGLVPFDTTVIVEKGDRVRVKPWENSDK